MNITTRTVLRHFLARLYMELDSSETASIDPFFETFFTKGELKEIIHTSYDAKKLKDLDLDAMDKEELLEVIEDDSIILDYFMEQWNAQTCSHCEITQPSVRTTLEQLSLQSHYLWCKRPEQWNAYDLSNYRSLQVKAGKICRVYGIYMASVKAEDVEKVTTPPNRFYDSQELAETALQELIAEKNFSPEELHILSLFAGR